MAAASRSTKPCGCNFFAEHEKGEGEETSLREHQLKKCIASKFDGNAALKYSKLSFTEHSGGYGCMARYAKPTSPLSPPLSLQLSASLLLSLPPPSLSMPPPSSYRSRNRMKSQKKSEGPGVNSKKWVHLHN